jgi:hypothetical protein
MIFENARFSLSTNTFQRLDKRNPSDKANL